MATATAAAGGGTAKTNGGAPKANGGTANEASYYECLNHRLAAMVPADALRVLDIGCGAGALGHHLKRAVAGRRVWGIEIIAEAGHRAEERLDGVVIGDVEAMEDLPYEPGSFDCLIFGDVLEHLVEPGQVLARMRALLAPGGSIVCCIPNVAHWSVVVQQLAGQFNYADAGLLDRTHLRFFTATTFRTLLEEHGFDVEAEEPLLFGRDDVVGALADAATAVGVRPDAAALALSTYQVVFRARPRRGTAAPRRVVDTDAHRTTTAVVVADGTGSQATVDAVIEAGAGEIVLVATGAELPQTSSGAPVRVLHAAGADFSTAAALGIDAARRDLVALVGPDVVPAPGWLARLHACLDAAGPSVAAVAPTSDRVTGPQLVDTYLPPAMWEGATPASVAAALAQHRPGDSVPAKILEPGCVLMRRAAYQQVGGFDPALGDRHGALDLWWRLRAAGGHLRVALDAFAHRRTAAVLGESTVAGDASQADALAAKLLAHYGRGAVPPASELWGVDWFRPGLDPWGKVTTFAVTPPWPDPGSLPEVLAVYLAAFEPADAVSLMVCVPVPGPVDAEHALGVVAAAIAEAGRDPDAIADIAITPLAADHPTAADVVWIDGSPGGAGITVDALRASVR